MIISGFADNILNISAITTILFGISVIINNNPVISILYLIGLIAIIASYLILEGFGFLGLSYLIVYLGAVSILFLFILMLIDIRLSELQSDTSNSIPLTLIIGIFFCYYLLQFLPYNIAIIGGLTKLSGALNLKLFNLLNEVTVTAKGKKLFLGGNYERGNSLENTDVVKANSHKTLSYHEDSESFNVSTNGNTGKEEKVLKSYPLSSNEKEINKELGGPKNTELN